MKEGFQKLIEDKLGELQSKKLTFTQLEEGILSIAHLVSEQMFAKRGHKQEYLKLEELHNQILELNHPLLKNIEKIMSAELTAQLNNIFDIEYGIKYLSNEIKKDSDASLKQNKLKNALQAFTEYCSFRLLPIKEEIYSTLNDKDKKSLINSLNQAYQQSQKIVETHFKDDAFAEVIKNYFQNNNLIQLLNKFYILETDIPHNKKDNIKISLPEKEDKVTQEHNDQVPILESTKDLSNAQTSPSNQKLNQAFSEALAKAKSQVSQNTPEETQENKTIQATSPDPSNHISAADNVSPKIEASSEPVLQEFSLSPEVPIKSNEPISATTNTTFSDIPESKENHKLSEAFNKLRSSLENNKNTITK